MGHAHYAWTFDPVAFHAWLEERVIVGGRFRPKRLRSLAVESARSDDPVAVGYLHAVRLDPNDEEDWNDWFGDGESDRLDQWYVLAMAGHLTPAPAISRHHWLWLLPQARPHRGCVLARTLARGDPLYQLPLWYGDDLLLAPVARHFSGAWGGWIHPSDPVHLPRALDELQGLWTPPPEHAADLEKAIEEAKAMLATARERGAALRVIRD